MINLSRRGIIRTYKVIVGSGPASDSYLRELGKYELDMGEEDYAVVRVGRNGLWRQFSDRNHLLGQKGHLLLPPSVHTGYEYMPVHEFVAKSEQSNADSFAKIAEQGNILDLNARVISIEKYGRNELLVTISCAGGIYEIVAQNVISAQGAGPERTHDAPRKERGSQMTRPFAEFSTGTRSLTGQDSMFKGGPVLIIGDGATAMWVAMQYRLNGNDVYVVGPTSGNAFSGANPGGTNSAILQWLKDENRICTGDVIGFEGRGILDASDPEEAGQFVYIKNVSLFNGASRSREVVLPVTRVVSCMGNLPSQLPNLLPCIRNDLIALRDPGLGSGSTDGIALSTKDRDLVVVGSECMSAAGHFNLTNFNNPGGILNQPNVSIPATDLMIRALVRMTYEQREQQISYSLFRADIHPAVASHDEFRRYFVSSGVDLRGSDEMSDQMIARRKEHPGEFTWEVAADCVNQLLDGKELVKQKPSVELKPSSGVSSKLTGAPVTNDVNE